MRWLLLLCLVGCGGRHTDPPARGASQGPGGKGRLVVVSIDGLMPEAWLHPDAHGLKIPTLRSLVARGVHAEAVQGVFPTVTYPSHTTLATGVAPAVHGITTNKPPDPFGKNYDGWRWYAEDIKVPTLWQAVEGQGRPVGLVTWPVTVGAKVTWNVPEYWRTYGEDDQKLQRALSTPGLLDRVAAASPDLWKYLTPPDVRDEAQFMIARYLVTHEKPELLMVHAWGLDDAQHDHAPWSAEAMAALENVDRLLGELLATLEAQPEWARTTFVVVSDHGFAPIDKEIRLDARFVERGLIKLDGNGDGKTVDAKVAVVASGGMALVYVLDPAADAAVRAALDGIEGVARRFEGAEIRARGGDPAAAYALGAAPGYGFADKRHAREVIGAVPGKGTHGFPPDEPAMASTFLAVGPHLPVADLGKIEMLDIAPTLARWVGVELPAPARPGLTIPRR
ncbi:MAG: alkaline phosphatase family protein [Deltaproteobacteria bacterium]|nr:alkaline phosphatase family protein [Deltaproteobacteria bacterium]